MEDPASYLRDDADCTCLCGRYPERDVFDGDVYGVGAGFGMLLLLMMAAKRHDGIQGRGIPGTGTILGLVNLDKGLRVVLGCICGMILMYVLHGIGRPLSGRHDEGDHPVGKLCLFTAVAWRISRTGDGLRLMQIGWHLLGAVLCGSALLAVYGLLELPYGIYHTADADISASGARLGGLLQYPNTFGAVMAAFLLERLFALPPVLRSRTGTQRAAAAAAAALHCRAAPDGVARRLARGALACAAGFAKERRAFAPLLVAAAAPLASAALLYRQLADAKLAPATARPAVAGRALGRRRPRRPAAVPLAAGRGPRRRYAAPGALGAAALLAAAAGALILHQVQDRTLGGAATLSARRLLYSDAWQLARSSLWLGREGRRGGSPTLPYSPSPMWVPRCTADIWMSC